MNNLHPSSHPENQEALLVDAFSSRISPLKAGMQPRKEALRAALTTRAVTTATPDRLTSTDIPTTHVSLFSTITYMLSSRRFAFAAAGVVVLVAGVWLSLAPGKNSRDARVAEDKPGTSARETATLAPASPTITDPTTDPMTGTGKTIAPPSDIDALASASTASESDDLSEEDTLVSDTEVDDSLLSLNSDIDENSF